MNETSLWTPIHWAARFGDVETIKLLISRKVKAFTPDYKCLCAIDLAGYFNHEEALTLLVDYSIDCYKELTLTATQSQLNSDFVLGEVIHSEDLFKHNDKFLSSPVYSSKLLYWAAHNKRNSLD